jgi:hypothetical protein
MTEHGLRAAINTPIQGGAADIVIAAMVKLNRDPYLKKLGFKMLLQIHDEVILVSFSFFLMSLTTLSNRKGQRKTFRRHLSIPNSLWRTP